MFRSPAKCLVHNKRKIALNPRKTKECMTQNSSFVANSYLCSPPANVAKAVLSSFIMDRFDLDVLPKIKSKG